VLSQGRPTIVIVGGGASGTLTALHLVTQGSSQTFSLVIVDSGGSLGRGVAFSTSDPSHLLNVRAGDMSAFPDDPTDFARWLLVHGHPDAHQAFAARSSFGAYLEDRLMQSIENATGDVDIEIMHDSVENIDDTNAGPSVVLKGGRVIPADAVVLATGLAPPKMPRVLEPVATSERFISDPWRASGTWPIGPSDDVTLIGSGLTAIDVILALASRGHSGSIRAISRHGLFPTTHRFDLEIDPDLSSAMAALHGTSSLELFRAVRRLTDAATRSGSDWRVVIDGLRPRLPALWRGLSYEERDRFMRLLVRYWDVHRHRMPLETAARLDSMRQEGSLTLRAGRLLKAELGDGGLVLTAKLRGEEGVGTETISTDWVVNCTGPQDQICFGGDPLATRLTERGLIRPGPLGIGIDTDENNRAKNVDGLAVPWLWSLGALMRGRLFESTAVPEIRNQAQLLSRLIHRYLETKEGSTREEAATTRSGVPRSVPARAKQTGSFEVVAYDSPDVGDRSYFVHDGTHALVIDPQRDISRLEAEASRRGVTISHVLETHIHNDYVSGGLSLSRSCGASYVLSADEPVTFAAERTGVRHGDVFRSGALEIEVMHTPGHTPHHLSYIVRMGLDDAALFSGGSMLHGSTGRTDLFDSAATEMLARAQWDSVHRMADNLDPLTTLYPTHGFGSFCASAPTQMNSDETLGEQWRFNPALMYDEHRFVSELLRNQRPHPRYFTQMAAINRRGALSVFRFELKRISMAEALETNGRIVVDLRPRRAFADGHLPGSINVEWGDSFASYLGWTIPWGAPITLVSHEWGQIEDAARSLAGIGISEAVGAVYEAAGPLATYSVVDFTQLRGVISEGRQLRLVDARDQSEWDVGHIPRAELMPFYCVEAGASLLPTSSQIWVHCARGYRAAIAASMLQRFQRSPVLIDDDIEHAVELGLLSQDGPLVGVASDATAIAAEPESSHH
jgi:hydroxyacylglutathione hydrolase